MNLIEKPPAKELRKFGLACALFSSVLISVLYFKYEISYFWYIIPLVFMIALLIPIFYIPLYYIMRLLGFILGYINTKVILTLIFFLIITPIGIVLRIVRKKLYPTKFDPAANSYWIKYEQTNDFTRQV